MPQGGLTLSPAAREPCHLDNANKTGPMHALTPNRLRQVATILLAEAAVRDTSPEKRRAYARALRLRSDAWGAADEWACRRANAVLFSGND